jgi:hypothetical protein
MAYHEYPALAKFARDQKMYGYVIIFLSVILGIISFVAAISNGNFLGGILIGGGIIFAGLLLANLAIALGEFAELSIDVEANTEIIAEALSKKSSEHNVNSGIK